MAVNNFFADLAALTLVNIFLKKRVRPRRILAGALIGTAGSCLLFALSRNLAVYMLLVHFVVNPAVLYFCLREKSGKVFFTDLCAGYFVFILMGGMMDWLYAGGRGFLSYKAAAVLSIAIGAVLVLWMKRQLKSRARCLEASVVHNGRYCCLKALSDSGCLLKDPYTGRPASMIDRDIYETKFGIPQAVRLIPYESLGCTHGLLAAVTVEEFRFEYENRQICIHQAVLGLADHVLFAKKPYQMIVNPLELSKAE